MSILGPDGNPVILRPTVGHRTVDILSSGPSRQQIRAYLRYVAFTNINMRYGLEIRRRRRGMALTLAKNKQFIAAIKEATSRKVLG